MASHSGRSSHAVSVMRTRARLPLIRPTDRLHARRSEGLQFANDVDHLELRRSGQFSLKVRPSTLTLAPFTWTPLAIMFFTFLRHVGAHAVVDAAAGEDDLRVVAQHVGLWVR